MNHRPARCRYVTADVFTGQVFHGNPLAVVLDADGLADAQMQAIAAEFNYAETTFVLRPRDPANTAWVRIFTPERELPFAGHPNVGTAFVLATRADGELPAAFVFEEGAGLVPVRLLRERGVVTGAEFAAPEPLSRRSHVAAVEVARCLGLPAAEVSFAHHAPQIVSAGLPFVAVELASRDGLRRARPDPAAYAALLPLDGATAIYAYTRDVGDDAAAPGCDLQSRMFPARMSEDPATGSATVAVAALLGELAGADIALRVSQGVDMGRPSLLLARVRRADGVATAYVGGSCVTVMEGVLHASAAA